MSISERNSRFSHFVSIFSGTLAQSRRMRNPKKSIMILTNISEWFGPIKVAEEGNAELKNTSELHGTDGLLNPNTQLVQLVAGATW